MSVTIPNRKEDISKVSKKDLPLSCPPQNTDVWNQHPRVYLPIEVEGKVVCPYCSAKYVLI